MRWSVVPLLALLGLGGLAVAQQTTSGAVGLAPEISRSKGLAGGVVLLWPRIVPASESAEKRRDAWFVQDVLEAAIKRAVPGTIVDRRPEPERVCPRGGCKAVAVGALLAHEEAGCAVVATISPPGESEARLLLMAGRMDIKARAIPFREPPESYVTIWDFDRCVDLGVTMDERVVNFENALKAALVGAAAPAEVAPTTTTPATDPAATGS